MRNLYIVVTRIVLSVLLAFTLALVACLPDPEPSKGIGTSPSEPVDDDPRAVCIGTEILPCGIWVDVDADKADARSLRGDPPDVVVYATEHTACADALRLAASYFGGKAFVREAVQSYRAKEAP